MPKVGMLAEVAKLSVKEKNKTKKLTSTLSQLPAQAMNQYCKTLFAKGESYSSFDQNDYSSQSTSQGTKVMLLQAPFDSSCKANVVIAKHVRRRHLCRREFYDVPSRRG